MDWKTTHLSIALLTSTVWSLTLGCGYKDFDYVTKMRNDTDTAPYIDSFFQSHGCSVNTNIPE